MPLFVARLSVLEIARLTAGEQTKNLVPLEWMEAASCFVISRMSAIPCDCGSLGTC